MEAVFIVLAVAAATPRNGIAFAAAGSAAALFSICLCGFGTVWLGEGEALPLAWG